MADEAPPSGPPSSPWSQRGFIMAGAMIAVLVVVAVVLLATGGGNDGDNSPGNAAPPASEHGAPAQETEAAPDPAASVCGLAPGDQAIPETPPSTRWQMIGTVDAPKADAGPARGSGVNRYCYAHSPTGALLAAANFMAIATVANNNDKVMERLTAPTPQRDELPETAEEGSGGTMMQVAGFRIPGANKDEVTVELAMNVSTSDGRQGVVSVSLPFRWERGDWKFLVTSVTDPYNTQGIESASGFIPWSGA